MSISNAKMSSVSPVSIRKRPRLLQYQAMDPDDSLFEFEDLGLSPREGCRLQQNGFGEYYALQDFEE